MDPGTSKYLGAIANESGPGMRDLRRPGLRVIAVAIVALAVCLNAGPAEVSGDANQRTTAEPPPFFPNVRITDGTAPFPHQVEPYIIVDARGRLVVGWKEAPTADGPGRRVGVARSLDGGPTWSPNVLMALANPGRNQSDPWLTTDPQNRTYFARLEYLENESTVVVSRSDDGGLTWGPMSAADDRPGFADKESMVVDGTGTLYVAYDDVVGNTTDIRLTRSSDAGMTWSPTVAVADRVGDVLAPVIAARPDGAVSVAWWNISDGNIMADASQDRGATWGTDVRVNSFPGSARWSNGTPNQISLPSVVSDSRGGLFIAWPDRGGGDLDILAARSGDGGVTWSTPVRVNDDSSRRDQWMVSLAVDRSDVLHAAWMDNRTGNWNVFYATSTDGGRTWTANLRVSTEETPSRYTRPGDYLGLAVDKSGVVYVAWTDGRGSDLDIYFARFPGSTGATTAAGVDPVVIALVGVAVVVPVLAYTVVRRRKKRGPPEPEERIGPR